MTMQGNRAQGNRAQGNLGEDIAVRHLIERGYEIVDRNCVVQFDDFRAEIDVIALDAQSSCVVFVEVKFRATDADGAGVAAISPKKLVSMRRGAGLWLAQNWEQCPSNYGARVDVIDVGAEGIRVHLKDVW